MELLDLVGTPCWFRTWWIVSQGEKKKERGWERKKIREKEKKGS